MHRIAIVGTTGAGKTTLAEQLGVRLGLPWVELDALHWEPDWQSAPREIFRERVSQALGDDWVADGNYSEVRDLVWGRADTLVWLDMPLSIALWRVITRTVRRSLAHEVLWGTNRESIRTALLSHDGLAVYLFQSHRRHRREYPRLFSSAAYGHLLVVRLRSPRAVTRWLEGLPLKQADGTLP